MSKQDLQNERLDRIGHNLLKAAKVSDNEIEKIVAAPKLFDSVKARIRIEQSQRKPKSFFGNLTPLFAWNRQFAAAVFAFLTVLVTVSALIIFKTKDAPQLAKQTTKQTTGQETQSPVAPVENIIPPASEFTERKISEVKTPATVEPAAFKSEAPKYQNHAPKSTRIKPSLTHKKEPQEVFYSLAVGGHWEANGEDLRIVRTELSRAELFALGVNLPVENETPKVKTDLLVSSDGVARAIRLVE